ASQASPSASDPLLPKAERRGIYQSQKRPPHPGRFHPGMVGDFISERWAISNRNGGRFHFGIVGDFERNQHLYAEQARASLLLRDFPAKPEILLTALLARKGSLAHETFGAAGTAGATPLESP
ncbi:hypothetical protein, partial [Bradyrhizobium zhanjiangense]|uniref:hypothetical protein n=1 Tax=Bradyrhizobium zhanjiangense TaxID=1325107 RepID=UPI0019D6FA07